MAGPHWRSECLDWAALPFAISTSVFPEERALATLETGYGRGIRLFDTAPLYGHGLSEHRLGHVLRHKPRA
ncbi:MAG TPA: aldo/keto reductase [Bradyrhizobium sp.]|nr:aldo/keto reductase [Bradyrhizobium sp.]